MITVNTFMKRLLVSWMLAGMIPAVMISGISSGYSKQENSDSSGAAEPSPEINVLFQDGSFGKMELEAYIVGVLLGEVSADFNSEALKAQAVASRTYTLYCIEVLHKHSGGAVCMDYHCCQAYCEPNKYLMNGGTEKELKRISDAVNDTAGEVLEYDSELICATYFASSGGYTENAYEVWGKNYPYLQSVASPGEEDCGYYLHRISLSPSEFQAALDVKLVGLPPKWFGFVKYTDSGGVDLMRIGGRLYTGVELRRLLNLRSTIMTLTAKDDMIIIETKGYGHRVGMSQHGADAMAENGSDYRTILCHYYTQTMLKRYTE